MANSVMMFDTLGYAPDHPDAAIAWRAVRKLLVVQERSRLLPALPVAGLGHQPGRPRAWRRRAWRPTPPAPGCAAADHWTSSATGRCAAPGCVPAAGRSSTPIRTIRTSTTPRWSACCCTATAIPPTPRRSTARASGSSACSPRDGGWGAFEPENTHLYLNHIPFADHGALLDPPTADVTARCVSFLAQIGMPRRRPGDGARAGLPAARAGGGRKLVRPLGHELHLRHVVGAVRAERGRRAARRSGGAARGGLAGLGAARRRRLGRGRGKLRRRAARPLQGEHAEPDRLGGARADGGGRGRSSGGGARHRLPGCRPSEPDGEWIEAPYTAVGFPRVFYLRYHGYRLYFPLLALARYRNLRRGNTRRVEVGF